MRRGEESTAHLLKSSPGVDGKDRNARGEQPGGWGVRRGEVRRGEVCSPVGVDLQVTKARPGRAPGEQGAGSQIQSNIEEMRMHLFALTD